MTTETTVKLQRRRKGHMSQRPPGTPRSMASCTDGKAGLHPAVRQMRQPPRDRGVTGTTHHRAQLRLLRPHALHGRARHRSLTIRQ